LNEIAMAMVFTLQLFSGVTASSSAPPMSTQSSLSAMAFPLVLVILFKAQRRIDAITDLRQCFASRQLDSLASAAAGRAPPTAP
jgi:hypothetical protein